MVTLRQYEETGDGGIEMESALNFTFLFYMCPSFILDWVPLIIKVSKIGQSTNTTLKALGFVILLVIISSTTTLYA